MNIRSQFWTITLAALFVTVTGLHAQLSEDFDDVAALPAQGWKFLNRSTDPQYTWYPGGANMVFPPQAGAPGSYVAVEYRSIAAGAGTISNWLLTPALDLRNGDVITFYTRTVTGSVYPDRLELRLSTSAESMNVGSTETSVGDFTTLLLSINPTLAVGGYPTEWTQYSVTLSGLTGGVEGRLGFRYFVTDGGPGGANSNYIGVDTLRVTSTAVPEPSTFAIGVGVLLGGVALLRRRAASRM